MNFKDVFLIGFFLTIGFAALPDLPMLGLALIITALLFIKFGLFFLLFTKLKLRVRTAFLSSLVLSNYSEFGLIVVALSVNALWIGKEWLVILALAVSFSFVITSVLYPKAHQLYRRYKTQLHPFESSQCLTEDQFIQPTNIQILVIGLGRVGRGAFDALCSRLNDGVAGMDADRNRILSMQSEGANVFFGDGEDADLWDKLDTRDVELILLALPTIEDSRNITNQLRKAGFSGEVAAIARYQDEREALLEADINHVFNFYTEAGAGFAEESIQLIQPK